MGMLMKNAHRQDRQVRQESAEDRAGGEPCSHQGPVQAQRFVPQRAFGEGRGQQ
jgi:hypothetical protein